MVVRAGIAGILPWVDSIGIMYSLLASVTERRREIGLRKAVGARRRDILLQFPAEVVAPSLVGGQGIAPGYGRRAGQPPRPQVVDIILQNPRLQAIDPAMIKAT